MQKKPKVPPQVNTKKTNVELSYYLTRRRRYTLTKFLGENFDITQVEKEDRSEISQIPPHIDATSTLARKEFDNVVKLMSNMKVMVGPDGVPSESIK